MVAPPECDRIAFMHTSWPCEVEGAGGVLFMVRGEEELGEAM